MHTLKLIQLYCHVCDHYNQFLRWNVQRFSPNGFCGQITDQEIITIYLFCIAYEEKYKVKSMHQHIQRYWLSWFPHLPAYQTFNARLNRLAAAFPLLVEQLIQEVALPADASAVLLGDSLPVITCSHKRAGKVAPELTDKGYCATKRMHFYGVKVHAVAQKRNALLPIPCLMDITPASVHDLTALRPVLEQIRAPIIVLDKAYCDAGLEKVMQANEAALLTPIKEKKGLAIRLKKLDKAYNDLFNTAVAKVRQPIESLFSWINELTDIQNASKIRSATGLMVHIFGRLAAALIRIKTV